MTKITPPTPSRWRHPSERCCGVAMTVEKRPKRDALAEQRYTIRCARCGRWWDSHCSYAPSSTSAKEAPHA